jgi:hypothetical protein
MTRHDLDDPLVLQDCKSRADCPARDAKLLSERQLARQLSAGLITAAADPVAQLVRDRAEGASITHAQVPFAISITTTTMP